MKSGIVWECPNCRGGLRAGESRWHCSKCGQGFRALRGIPDLRTAEDAYLSNGDDWAFAAHLEQDYDRLDFRGFLDRYFELSPDIPEEWKRGQIDHILHAPARVRGWLEALGGSSDRGATLDLGCGSGSFLAAVGRDLEECCGVDIALRWLLVARKRLEEAGLREIPLVCACAESLPLSSGRFAAVVAGDVIEHVADQAAILAEAHRVLRPGGRLFLASPNRFSLAPEPHVHVWGVGFLPRAWMNRYVQVVRGIEFRAIRTLGIHEWTSLLRSSPFGSDGTRIEAPPLPVEELQRFAPIKRMFARFYNAAISTWPGQRLARLVGPLFHVVCEKRPAGVRSP